MLPLSRGQGAHPSDNWSPSVCRADRVHPLGGSFAFCEAQDTSVPVWVELHQARRASWCCPLLHSHAMSRAPLVMACALQAPTVTIEGFLQALSLAVDKQFEERKKLSAYV